MAVSRFTAAKTADRSTLVMGPNQLAGSPSSPPVRPGKGTSPANASLIPAAGAPWVRRPAYAEHARSYERDTAPFQPYRRAVVEALPLRRGQVVLDVGCGTGLCCGLLRDKVGPQGGVVGIEESPQMAALAREHVAGEGWDNVTVVLAPAEEAQIGLAADAALFCAVHDIMQSPRALRNVMTTLRPGAWVAAGGGKWAAPVMMALNSPLLLLHPPSPPA